MTALVNSTVVPIDQHLTFLDKRITEIQQQIDTLIDQHPDLRQKKELLTFINGIGDITAAFLGEIPDIAQFYLQACLSV